MLVGGVIQYTHYYLPGGMEYRKTGSDNTRLEAIYHAEGRYANIDVDVDDSPTWQKEYTLKDHLGNARITFTDKNGNGMVDVPTDIVQENHYYPFGYNYEGAWRMNDAGRDQKYLYNYKELNDDFGLNLYAYGARYYDAAIGRFTGVDPIADQFAWVSPFNYAENEPIANIDLWGLQKYKPQMQPLEKPSDLLSRKMLNNTYEGFKTIAIEAKSVMNQIGNAVGRWLDKNIPDEGSPKASQFNDSNSSHKGSGIELLSNTEKNSNGTLALPSADKGSTVIIEESEIGSMKPADAGGVVGDAAKSAGGVPNILNAMGLVTSRVADVKEASDAMSAASKTENNNKTSKPDTSYTVKTPFGTHTVTRFSPKDDKNKN